MTCPSRHLVGPDAAELGLPVDTVVRCIRDDHTDEAHTARLAGIVGTRVAVAEVNWTGIEAIPAIDYLVEIRSLNGDVLGTVDPSQLRIGP